MNATARDKFYASSPRCHTVIVPASEIDEATEGEITEALEVAYAYHPGERRTWDQPGCAADVEVLAVFVEATGERVEIPACYRDGIEAACWDDINSARIDAMESRAEARKYARMGV